MKCINTCCGKKQLHIIYIFFTDSKKIATLHNNMLDGQYFPNCGPKLHHLL